MHTSETLTFCILVCWVGAEPELPLCPTNIQFLPQNLPMHCRMPTNSDVSTLPKLPNLPEIPTMPPFLPPFYQSPPPDSQPPPIPIPVPGMPAFPGAMMQPMLPPPNLPPPGVGPMHKLPVIVMPFYSPDPSYKKTEKYKKNKKNGIKSKHRKRRHRYHSDTSTGTDYSDTDTDTDTTDSDEIFTDTTGSDSSRSSDTSREKSWWNKGIGRGKNTRRFLKRHRMRKSKRRSNQKELLTPILQYVTKDGYVIYEKKISKGEAKSWLGEKKAETFDGKEIEEMNTDKDSSIEDNNDIRRKVIKTEVAAERSGPKKHFQKTGSVKSTKSQLPK